MEQGPSDLGRRATRRRQDLGLSRTDVAERARMSQEFLAYLEEHPNPNLSEESVAKLAHALETDQPMLLGGRAGLAPGGDEAAPHPRFEELDTPECRALLGRAGIGRVVFDSEDGLGAHPVNYRVVDGDIVFRTDADTEAARAARSGTLAFEVDRIDEAMRAGWSVLVRGDSDVVDPALEDRLREALDLESWAGGERDTFVRLHPSTITGRRIATS